MSMISYTSNQRKAIELLGYKRWLMRQHISEYHHDAASDSSSVLKDKYYTERVREVPQHMQARINSSVATPELDDNTHDTFASRGAVEGPVSVAEVSDRDNPRSIDNPGQDSASERLDYFTVEDIDVYLSDQMTLLQWSSELTNALMVMSLPPLWGTIGSFTLFASELECQLLVNALHSCELNEIADKLVQTEAYIREHAASLTLSKEANIGLNNQQLEPSAMVLIINATLPSLHDFKQTLLDSQPAQVFVLSHPYECLQKPKKKAELWHQLINLKAKI